MRRMWRALFTMESVDQPERSRQHHALRKNQGAKGRTGRHGEVTPLSS